MPGEVVWVIAIFVVASIVYVYFNYYFSPAVRSCKKVKLRRKVNKYRSNVNITADNIVIRPGKEDVKFLFPHSFWFYANKKFVSGAVSIKLPKDNVPELCFKIPNSIEVCNQFFSGNENRDPIKKICLKNPDTDNYIAFAISSSEGFLEEISPEREWTKFFLYAKGKVNNLSQPDISITFNALFYDTLPDAIREEPNCFVFVKEALSYLFIEKTTV